MCSTSSGSNATSANVNSRMTWSNKELRRPQHAATVGLLLCTDKNDRIVRYSLATSNQPMAIASYDLLAPAEQAALPSEADLTRALE